MEKIFHCHCFLMISTSRLVEFPHVKVDGKMLEWL